MAASRPSHREGFEIAIICALPLEYDAVSLVFDDFWDEDGDKYGRAPGDYNRYTTGRIGNYNVVLALLARMGKVSAASAAVSLRSSYSRLRVAFLVGICGGAPQAGDDEILLGDVVISKTIVQYDFGRQYPGGFVRKDNISDNLGKPNKDVQNLLVLFETNHNRERLRRRTAALLKQLQAKAIRKKYKSNYMYPGTAKDKLFDSGYRHGRDSSLGIDTVCNTVLNSTCEELGCDEGSLLVRERLKKRRQLELDEPEKAQEPTIYVGSFASGDTVMKSAFDRDRIARKESIIAFEMEGAGIWEEVPCIIVKGVCDYADCHKNKIWQDFAAATAASAVKAVLELFTQTDNTFKTSIQEMPPLLPQHHWIVPFGRNEQFVGRKHILRQLLEMIPPSAVANDCQRVAIVGLGGVGKTQIALEAAFQFRDEYPDCSVFWIPAVDTVRIENAFREIGRQLKVKGIDEDGADIKQLVKAALSQENIGNWLLIIDNLDNIELFFGNADNADSLPLSEYLPFSRKGSILITTRNDEVAVRLDIHEKNTIATAEMARDEALEMLQSGLKTHQTCDIQSTMSLLELLTYLPLAIRQASAFMRTKHISSSEYLELCQSSSKDMVYLLSKDFEDRHRYKESRNPVAMTWLISFQHISSHNLLAVKYLSSMCCLAEKDIPQLLLPPDPLASQLEIVEAIGTLKSYAFITHRKESDSFDTHRLVRLAMRSWLEKEKKLGECVTHVIQRVAEVFPFPELANKDMWMKYLPHAQAALDLPGDTVNRDVKSDLLSSVGSSLHLLGKYRESEAMHRQSFMLRKMLLGEEHPSTLATMGDMAVALRCQGNYKEAEASHRQALSGREKVLGEEHPSTLMSLNNLALVLRDQARYKEAEVLFRQALCGRKEVLGAENPDTLASINYLAVSLLDQGKHKEAKELFQEALRGRERVLGETHSDTLSSVNNMARVLRYQGRYKEAEALHRRALNGRIKTLGEDHPETLGSMNNLALVLRDQSNYTEAEALFRRALDGKSKLLGKTHIYTLLTMSNLAVVLRGQHKNSEAEALLRLVLEEGEKTLGKDHPDTLTAVSNLAVVLRSQRKYQEAEALSRRALWGRTRLLGEEHPKTLKSLHNLILVLRGQCKYEEAESLLHQAPGPRL
ncbi:uncharacterized protein TRIVIDRAFT_214185 [Trichoderma virens Gv29-8]|uniref:Uncharacterized protein n=1 Tax=Hypocrea virens (strain Gv29-8 / FGSC 10586) TaxID=413071 RepID=G9N6L9_HYPVG|nr:uncharacterized protein TRIVIDRAFT_214185 [Trichoderma virens Gv29-8]EHK17779.1 hypothetical protein TRIVIDRAFT_214185 [Trichoderma virens Gv29-8]